MSTLWSTWLLVGIAFGTLSVSGVMAENTIDISVLMKQVQSGECRKRLEAIDLLLKQTSAAAIPALKQEITQQSPRAAEYLKSVFEFVTLGERAGDEAEAVVRSALEKARKEAGENDETRTTRAVVTLLMAEIKSNRHPYTRAYLVGVFGRRTVTFVSCSEHPSGSFPVCAEFFDFESRFIIACGRSKYFGNDESR